MITLPEPEVHKVSIARAICDGDDADAFVAAFDAAVPKGHLAAILLRYQNDPDDRDFVIIHYRLATVDELWNQRIN